MHLPLLVNWRCWPGLDSCRCYRIDLLSLDVNVVNTSSSTSYDSISACHEGEELGHVGDIFTRPCHLLNMVGYDGAKSQPDQHHADQNGF